MSDLSNVGFGAYGSVNLADIARRAGATPRVSADGTTTFVDAKGNVVPLDISSAGSAAGYGGGFVTIGPDGQPHIASPSFGTAFNGSPVGTAGTPGAGGATGQPDTSGGTADQKSAQAIIQNLLDSYGLGSLAGWAWGLITQGAGASQVELQLRQRPEFAARFPGIAMREKNGLPPISPGEYVTYEKQATELFHQAGLPPDFYRSSDHLASFIGSDVSLSELGQRVQQGYAAAMQAPAEVRNQLQNVYGIDAGHLTAFFLDPDQALPLVMKKFQAAKIGAEGVLTGYGQLGQGSLEDLAARGVTDTQARQGFNHLGMESQLFEALPGSAESNISQQVQLGAEFGGNAEDQKMIENQARGRVAEFGGGYGYAGSATGVSGLGSAKQ